VRQHRIPRPYCIFEVLPVTTSVRSVLLRTPTEAAVGAAARAAGMTSLRAAGLARARRGETTFEEVLRVTQLDMTDGRRCVSCDRSVTEDMVACPWCATVVDRGHCTSCARPLETGWKICPWCREPAVSAPTAGSSTPPSRRPRLLFVGDDETIRDAIMSAADEQLDVDTATTADAAIARVWDNEYDGLVVQDSLTDLAGAELVRTLRTMTRTAALPVLLVSDLETQGDRAGVQARLTELLQRAADQTSPDGSSTPQTPEPTPPPAVERRRVPRSARKLR
jgi:RNA polymerase subunit RPABC4/transcription elongation factor Spt4